MRSPSKKKKTNLRPTIVGAIGIFVLLVVLGCLVYRNHLSSNTNAQSGPTPEQRAQQQQADSQAKQDAVEKGDTSNSQSTTPPPVSSDSVSLSARQESNGSVTVFAKLKGVSSGTCELVVTNGSKKVTQTADVIYQPEYSSCAGFSVPISSLGTGTWSISLNATAGDSKLSSSITYEVK